MALILNISICFILQPEFCLLSHIVKLDLSSNQISSLPPNFGHLQKLQILDLYNNQLTSLPVTVCHLKSLKWLDLKNNPLSESLQKVAGDCLDDVQCKKCATNVSGYLYIKPDTLLPQYLRCQNYALANVSLRIHVFLANAS